MRYQLALIISLFLTSTVLADSVYKWVDENGVVQYSSKPIAGAAPAKLPQIMRGEYKLADPNKTSCAQHGGINCEAGADADGSVICADGYKDAMTRYRFHCNTAKIAITDISTQKEDGTYVIAIRNNKSVQAEKVSVTFVEESGAETPLEGPSEIAPFGVESYTLSTFNPLEQQPQAIQFQLRCLNCE